MTQNQSTMPSKEIMTSIILNGDISKAVDWLSCATIVERTISSRVTCFPYFLLKNLDPRSK